MDNDAFLYAATLWVSGFVAGIALLCLAMVVGIRRGWIYIREVQSDGDSNCGQ
jgi:hypothetical protein